MSEQRAAGSDNLILRLAAIARGLEDEGQNNIAKLFRAAALGEIYRWEQGRPRQGDGLEGEIRSVVSELSSRSTTSEPLKSAMAYAVEAFERGEWPMLADIPEPHVCRFCGEVMIGEPPEYCPNCRARSLTFQEIRPIFYLEPLEPDDVQRALESNLADVERSVEGVDEAQADRGPWPMRDMMSHLIGAQELMIGRAKRMLDEDDPNLGSIPPTDIGVGSGDGPPRMSDLLKAYRESRRELIELTRSLSDEEFSRPGRHPEWGPLTVLSQLTYLVRHEQSHLAELEARRHGR